MQAESTEYSVVSEMSAARKEVRTASYSGVIAGALMAGAGAWLGFSEVSNPKLHVENGLGPVQFIAIAVLLLLGSFLLGVSLNNLKAGLYKIQITSVELVHWYDPRKPFARRMRWDAPDFRVVLKRNDWLGDARGWSEDTGLIDSSRLNKEAWNAIVEAAKRGGLTVTVRPSRGWGGLQTVTEIGPRKEFRQEESR